MGLFRVMALAAGCLAAAAPALAETRVLQVLSVTLYPGDALSPALLAERSFTGSAKVLTGYVERAGDVQGKFARRTLVAGRPIPLAAIRNADAVFEGQPVQATYRSGGLSITTTLLPLESGAAGDEIKARNPDSGLTVTAIAQPDGTLLIGDP
jgi:flagellar basal body P-ring formation protein FlgA